MFIFTTDSSLTIGPGSSINVIRGAQECNIFWRVGSSASLDTGAVFRGNILAQTSISLNDSVVVHGRALAQTGGVTLIDDTFINPTCATLGNRPDDGCRAGHDGSGWWRRRVADDCGRRSGSRCDNDDAGSHRRHRRTAAHRCRTRAGARLPVLAAVLVAGVGGAATCWV